MQTVLIPMATNRFFTLLFYFYNRLSVPLLAAVYIYSHMIKLVFTLQIVIVNVLNGFEQ